MLNKVLIELDDLIDVEKTRDPGSKRTTTSIVLTWRGEVAARVLKAGFRRKHITLAELKAELAARQAEQNPWACQIQKDAEHRREFDRRKAAGWTWRPPKTAKTSADPPRETAETSPSDAPTSPRPIAAAQRDYTPPAEHRQRLTPPADLRPDATFEEVLAFQDSIRTNTGPPVRNLPKATDAADDARILTRFHSVPFPGDLQPDSKTVMFGGRLYTLQAWELAYFKQSE